jgi:hypothetical protein
MLMGKAMKEVYQKSPKTKNPMDEKAFSYLMGLISSMDIPSAFDYEALYNNINHVGGMIFGPVEEGMNEYARGGNDQFKVSMTLHEFSHSLLEGTTSLVAVGAISKEN